MKKYKIIELIVILAISLTFISCSNSPYIDKDKLIAKDTNIEVVESKGPTNEENKEDVIPENKEEVIPGNKDEEKDSTQNKEVVKNESEETASNKSESIPKDDVINSEENSSKSEEESITNEKNVSKQIVEEDKAKENNNYVKPKSEIKVDMPKQEVPKPKENTVQHKEQVVKTKQQVINNEDNFKFSSEFADKGERFQGIEDAIFKYTNEERVSHGLKPFIRDSKLDFYGRCKSYDMGAREYFEHEDKDGVSVWNHILHDNYMQYGNWGENIIFTSYIEDENGKVILNFTDDQLGKYMVDCWMKSPGHRANILNPKFDRLGVGIKQIKQSDIPTYFGTQEFSHIIK